MRKWPVGAEVVPEGAHFRVWAPRRRRVAVRIEDGPRATAVPLTAERGGYFSGLVEDVGDGALYRFLLDDDPTPYPDPASRFQPEGPHGPSRIVDPRRYAWTATDWRGLAPEGQVLYEMHVGTFTPEGTWAAAAEHLAWLADLGITAIEMMPVSDFAGRFGWGYDGVDLFAPTRLYGTPDDLRRFVDRAHAVGLGVILDVVYNHLGPDGNYLPQFSESYFTDRHPNEWGEAIDFDGPDAAGSREFFLTNAAYWIDEFRFDGLRLDATQQMFDRSEPHVLAQISRAARAAGGGRGILLVTENEPQDARMLRAPERGGYGLDAMWNDDFHHSAIVAMTGRYEAYYNDYRGTPQEFVSAAKHGFLYQGQRYEWQGRRRGTPALDLEPFRFVTFLQNHDQVANSGHGRRIHDRCDPGVLRAMTALLLLGPGTPMLFQGQEFAASSPFLYFADHRPELAEQVAAGRAEFLKQFPRLATPTMQRRLAHPADPRTFERCRLDHAERGEHREVVALHRDLLRLRRTDPAFRRPRRGGIDGAVLGEEAFVLRWFDAEHGDRLLVVNLDRDLTLVPAPEPLLAPPESGRWTTLWSSDDPRYGGPGAVPIEDEDGRWRIHGHTATVLGPGAAARAV